MSPEFIGGSLLILLILSAMFFTPKRPHGEGKYYGENK